MAQHLISEWLEAIIDPELREKALKNLRKNPSASINKTGLFSSALTHAFDWSGTPDGFEFWNKISYRSYNGEPFTTLCEGYKPENHVPDSGNMVEAEPKTAKTDYLKSGLEMLTEIRDTLKSWKLTREDFMPVKPEPEYTKTMPKKINPEVVAAVTRFRELFNAFIYTSDFSKSQILKINDYHIQASEQLIKELEK